MLELWYSKAKGNKYKYVLSQIRALGDPVKRLALYDELANLNLYTFKMTQQFRQDFIAAWNRGDSYIKIEKAFKIGKTRISYLSKLFKLKSRLGASDQCKPERDAAVVADRKKGLTLSKIATAHGITKQRVAQILEKELDENKLLQNMPSKD